jgi:Aspartyl protease/PDZ domain
MMKRTFLIIFLCCLFSLSLHAEEDRLWVDAKINDKPVKLVFDTGSEFSFLLRPTAERLGLHVTNWSGGTNIALGKTPYGIAESCELSLSGLSNKVMFGVIDVPAGVHSEIDGTLGWECCKRSIVAFDCANHRFAAVDQPPEAAARWNKVLVRTNADLLILEVSDKTHTNGSILIDTGDEGGVSLAPKLWKEWTAAHPDRKRTLGAYFTPNAGVVVREFSWADELSFGSLILHDVPVREATPGEVAMGEPGFRATFGFTALKRLALVVDGKNGVAYFGTYPAPPTPYSHNRAGAVFVPDDLEKSEYLTARVLPGTPAYEANVRAGDVLLKIDDVDATHWRTNSAMRQSDIWEQPAGTKVRVTLKREDKELQTTIVLRDLIGP